ncbi:MAG: hypothetical protein HY282_03230 [Nitrospirae bacterium]|nr:hypothetical protein [Candidatus Manganitrophaceae bacterium]
MDRMELLKRLREKILGRLERPDPPSSIAEIFSLVRDLNYLHLRLLRVVGARRDLPPSSIAALLGVEGIDSEALLAQASGWTGRSDGLLLEAADLLPLICLHQLPPPVDLAPPESPAGRETQKDRVISLLLKEIRFLKEKNHAQGRSDRTADDGGALPPRL